MKFVDAEGDVFQGKTYERVVKQMSKGKLTDVRDIPAYREATADRIMQVWPHVTIDPSTNRTFVKTLVSAGVLKAVA